MVKRTNAQKANPTNQRWMKILATIFSLLLVALGIVTLVLIQRPIQESQDLRRAASIEAGLVEVSATASLGTVGEASRITLNANTNSAQTHGIQLIFKVNTQAFGDLDVALADGLGLQIGYQEVEAVADGFLVGIIAIPTPSQAFSTTTSTPFLHLDFIPTQAGDITLEFDPAQSISILYESDPPDDQLKTISNQTYTIAAAGSDDTGGGGDDTGGGGDDTGGGGDDTGGGGDDTGGGGDDTGIGGIDQDLNRVCNEYCADSRECAAGLTCYNNLCRRPDNPESSSCSAPDTETISMVQRTCNESCSSNADCGTNLRCYQGACRLATNPSSASCSTSTESTVSTIYITETVYVTPSPRTAPKGGTVMISGTPSPEATTSAGLVEERPLIKFPTPTPEGISDVAPPEEASTGIFAQLGQFAYVIIGAGIGLLFLILLWIFLGRKKDKDQPPKPPAYQPTPQEATQMDSLQQKIETMKTQPPASSINSTTSSATMPAPLPRMSSPAVMGRNLPSTPPAPQPTSSFTPPAQPSPMSSASPHIGDHLQTSPVANRTPFKPVGAPPTSPQVSSPTSPVPTFSSPNATPQPGSMPSSGSSMVDRLKQKGMNLPDAPKST